MKVSGRLCAAAAVALVAVGPLLSSTGRAARDLVTGSIVAATTEVVIFEAPGCVYCELFRRDVLPGYQASLRARTTPLRFVDVDAVDRTLLPSAPPLAMLPTTIILRDGQEIGRIEGYTGPDNFQAVLTHVLGPAGQ